MRSRLRRWSPLLAMAVLIVLGAPVSAADAVRDELRSHDPAWYDAENDDWRRVDAEAPEDDLEGDSSVSAPMSGLVPTLLYAVLVAAVIGLVVWVIVALKDQRRQGRSTSATASARAPSAAVEDLPIPADPGADPERERAAAWARGDWQAWIVWHYACLLLIFDRLGIVAIERGKTNRSYLHEAAAHGARGRLLAEVVAVFERSWFGGQRVDAETAQALERDSRRMFDHGAST